MLSENVRKLRKLDFLVFRAAKIKDPELNKWKDLLIESHLT